MDKAYDPKLVEGKIYEMWEKGGYFSPKIDKKKSPFTIILPPPNANADLHLGHAMYVVEDIMIRYHRMRGDPTLWLPGADHAGFETQYVFEKELAKKDKSRFDFSRDDLYKMIWDFVHENLGKMEGQLRALGFSLDWTRNVFTLDSAVVTTVYTTFKRLFDSGLVYRGLRLVNYCTKDGTGFSDLEVKHVEQKDPLYYMKYGPFILATVRPETKFGDTAVAVNPKDKRYKKWIGKEIEVEGLLGKFKITVVGDDVIDPAFGTGVAKVTPSHDFTDFEIAKRHNLPSKQVIGFDGRLTDIAGHYKGLKVKAAREKVVAEMQTRGLIDHIDQNYTHTVATCYKCGTIIEPLPLEQWYVKIKPLATQAVKAIQEKKIAVVPKRFEKHMTQWLTNFQDWNISRQLVWGMRIPAWKCSKNHWTVTGGKKPEKCRECGETNLEQDTDTFDTWFSSGQWPFATLQSTGDFDYFYPTSVMETAYDILPWWVCRMIMLGLYVTGDVPFRTVYYHGLVRDSKGQKMSKSKGNVINPIKMVDQYGADALRFSLIFGTAAGHDQSLSNDKIRGMRNFSNKLWNIGRFLILDQNKKELKNSQLDKELQNKVALVSKTVTKHMGKYQFSQAAEILYEFTWHEFADKYLEVYKKGEISYSVLLKTFATLLSLLHPFMPFVTEEIWKILGNKGVLITSPWPNP